MSKSADDDKSRWDQMMESVDLLFHRMNDIGVIQQELKTQMQENNKKVDKCAAEQQFIAQQVRTNGQAVAQLTLQQFDKEPQEFSDGSVSVIFEEEEDFLNVFAHTNETHKPSTSKQPRHT